MRKTYLVINFGLLALAGSLLAANWSFQTPPPDPALKWQPEAAAPTAAPPPAAATPEPAARIQLIRQKNPFSPLRGEEPQKDESQVKGPAAPPRFELVGICLIGEQSGAIIEAKSAEPAGPAANRKRRYYPVGGEVLAGFVLDSVAENSAVLKRKNETLELKVSRSRFAAEMGRSGSAAKAAEPPPRPVNPVLQPNPAVAARPAAVKPLPPPGGVNPVLANPDSGDKK